VHDIHEADTAFQDKVRQEYLRLAEAEPTWELIDLVDPAKPDTIVDVATVHRLIKGVLAARNIIAPVVQGLVF